MKELDQKDMAENERQELQDRYVRFDWAIKRLLRQKANFGVLNGFLTVMLREEVNILEILESESNQESADDKFNRVDIKARNSKGEIIIVEIQNTREVHYLERILYGVAKAITEHISLGEGYQNVLRKDLRRQTSNDCIAITCVNTQTVAGMYAGEMVLTMIDIVCSHTQIKIKDTDGVDFLYILIAFTQRDMLGDSFSYTV